MPLVRRGNDDGVDVLVFEHAAQVLLELRLEGGNVLQPGIVDPLRREVPVDVAERLDLDVLQLRKAALQGITLTTDADAGRDHLIVGAEHPAAHMGRRVGGWPEELTADDETCCRRPNPRREVAPGDTILVVPLAGHGDLLFVWRFVPPNTAEMSEFPKIGLPIIEPRGASG